MSLQERFNKDLAFQKIPQALSIKQLIEWNNNVRQDGGGNLKKRLELYDSIKIKQRAWAEELTEILNSFTPSSLTAARNALFVNQIRLIPFQEALVPFVNHASKQIHINQRVDKIVLIQCERYLLQELSTISVHCFYHAFKKYKLNNKTKLLSKYQQFIKTLYRGSIYDFFKEFSYLARFLIHAITKWQVRTTLLFHRIESDYTKISKSFFDSVYLGKVSSISYSAMVSHDLNGSVATVTFETGAKIIYKPRSSKLDSVYAGIVHWMNSTQHDIKLFCHKTLDRNDYSWHEFLCFKPCKTEIEVKEFYYKLGYIAGILQVTGANDYHYGNIIAQRDNPVLIDNETLFSPDIRIENHRHHRGDTKIAEMADNSIVRSLLLMDTLRMIYSTSTSIAGALAKGETISTTKFLKINQDQMSSRRVSVFIPGKNIPRLNGKLIDPKDYLNEATKGYFKILQFLSRQANPFYALIKKLTNNFQIELRLLVRSSSYYSELLKESLQPRYLREGIDRSIYFEKLAGFYIHSKSPEEVRGMLSDELRMVDLFYSPWFHVGMSQKKYLKTLKTSGTSVITRSAVEVFDHQLQSIKSRSFRNLQFRITSYYVNSGPKVRSRTITNGKIITPIRDQYLLKQIFAVAKNLQFIYRHFLTKKKLRVRYSQTPAQLLSTYNLHNGLLGVAVCWAACYRIQGKQIYRDTIYYVTEPLLSCIHSTSNKLMFKKEIGGYRGAGSILYVLTILFELTGEKKYIDGASALLKRVPVFKHHHDLSVENGSSGYLLSLIKLHNYSKSPALHKIILAQRITLTEIILNQKIKLNLSSIGWNKGWPGVLFTLFKLYEVEPDETLKKQIFEIVRSYNLRVMPQIHSLKSERRLSVEDASLADGITGWVLMMTQFNKIFNTQIEEVLLNNFITQLTTDTFYKIDYVSQGTLGIAELISANNDHVNGLREKLIDQLILKFNKNQKYLLNPKFSDYSFFEGASGIIYQQLRLLFPDKVPSAIMLS